MNQAESLELLRRFCTAYYDEWVVAVLNGKGGPLLTAGLCRSLEAAVGEVAFSEFIEVRKNEGTIKIVADFKTARWDAPAWVLLDYM